LVDLANVYTSGFFDKQTPGAVCNQRRTNLRQVFYIYSYYCLSRRTVSIERGLNPADMHFFTGYIPKLAGRACSAANDGKVYA
jgi:hypothetical protein